MNSSLRVVFFGTPHFVIPVAKILRDNFDLVGIVTAPDAVQGRKKIITPSPLKEFGLEQSILTFTYDVLNQTASTQLASLNADVFVVAAYGTIIPQTILDLPKKAAINIHPSLLPTYRGPSPIQSAILNGDQTSGISIIQMDAEVDHGPIITQWEYPLTPTDTFESLHIAMFEDAAEKLPKIISDYLDNKIAGNTQDDTKATFCEKITRESGYFESTNPPTPEKLDSMIRAYYPWPNAWTKLQVNNKLQIVKFYPKEKIQMEGKNIVSIKEFLNGYPELREEITTILGKKE